MKKMMIMRYITITVLMLLSFSGNIIAQSNPEYNEVQSVTGPKGNYLYIVKYDDIAANGGSVFPTDVFTIERVEVKNENSDINSSDWKEIGTCRAAQNYSDLTNYYPSEDLENLKEQYGNISNKQLGEKFKNISTPDSIPFLYGFVETKQALGHVFLDSKVTQGYLYYYRITKISANGDEEKWGGTICKAGLGNYTLPNLKPQWTNATGRDSMVNLHWTLPYSEEKYKAIPIPRATENSDLNTLLSKLPFHHTNLRARVMVSDGDQYIEKATILPTLSENEDSLYFHYYETEVTAPYVKSFIVLQDEVYNEGIPSDTAIAYPQDSSTVDIIYQINVTDTLNGIHIAWEPLPSRPYYSGIEILRYDSDDVLDSVAVLSPNETSYIDRKLEVGQYYRYHVKALFVPQGGMVQRLAAQATGSYTKFTKPLPPINLKGEPTGNFIRLDWEAVDEPSIYGYYIYRGTSPKNLSLAAGPIFEKTFVDSLSSLSGRTHYNYAVASQNFRQDTSQFSNIVSVKPDKAISMVVPPSVDIYYVNGELKLSWKDVRANDNIIESYILQRKTGVNGRYATIHRDDLRKPSFTDTDIIEGESYYYRVAAKSIYGDQTEFSDGSIYKVEFKKVETINKFYARNVTGGIKVTIPNMSIATRKSFNIYRKIASEETFTKVTSIPASQFEYLDDNVVADQYYVYVVTVTDTNDREGVRGRSVTVHTKKK